jgi:hypothetical protein
MKTKASKICGFLNPQSNNIDRQAAADRRSYCQLLLVEGCSVVSATGHHGH